MIRLTNTSITPLKHPQRPRNGDFEGVSEEDAPHHHPPNRPSKLKIQRELKQQKVGRILYRLKVHVSIHFSTIYLLKSVSCLFSLGQNRDVRKILRNLILLFLRRLETRKKNCQITEN